MLIVWSLADVGIEADFNTSHVNVNPRHCNQQIHLQIHFNTSHVNVNHRTTLIPSKISTISIHLMLMLIITKNYYLYLMDYFNTSHVNVNLDFTIKVSKEYKFQYISC